MKLLNFKKLRERFESKEVKSKIKIILYSKRGNELFINSNNEETKRDSILINILEENKADGSVGEVTIRNGIILVGIGSMSNELTIVRNNVSKSMKSVYDILKKYDKSEISFEEGEFIEDAIHGLIMCSYSYDFLKSKKEDYSFSLKVLDKYKETVEIAHSQNFARFLSDTPANHMTPSLFVEYVKEYLKDSKTIDLKVYDKSFMEEKGMNLILSVAQGSKEEPKLVCLEYMGNKNEKSIDIGLVGKGVTFDSGGISLKPRQGMYSMKRDMAGAAILFSTLVLASSMKLPINLKAVFPLVENLPGPTATKPGDVFKSLSGKTVEVDNTDAEGRLILADALTFIQKSKPKYLIDTATLTSAIAFALGNVYGGFFTNDEHLSQVVYKASQKTNQLMWRMPLSTLYRDTLKSQVADLNNMGGDGAGSCKAAGFLKEFVEDDIKWAHLDIAGIEDKAHNSEIYGKEATGMPLATIYEMLSILSQDKK